MERYTDGDDNDEPQSMSDSAQPAALKRQPTGFPRNVPPVDDDEDQDDGTLEVGQTLNSGGRTEPSGRSANGRSRHTSGHALSVSQTDAASMGAKSAGSLSASASALQPGDGLQDDDDDEDVDGDTNNMMKQSQTSRQSKASSASRKSKSSRHGHRSVNQADDDDAMDQSKFMSESLRQKRSPFDNQHMLVLWTVAQVMVRPFYLSINYFLAAFVSTDGDTTPWYWTAAQVIALFFAVVISFPFAMVAWPLYCVTESMRRPLTFSIFGERHARPLAQSTLTVVSANLGLPPEFIGRQRNVRNVIQRAERAAIQLLAAHINAPSAATSTDEEPFSTVVSKFPPADFACFQGVYDRNAEQKLIKLISKQYPYFVHNVGQGGWRSNHFALGSGLLLASKYPILEAEFVPFQHAAGFERFLSKGVLMAKVFLVRAQRENPYRTVGYFWITNLQNAEHEVRSAQMDEVGRAIAQFRKETFNRSKEIIGFQIMAGDLGFDNVSEEDEPNWNHHVLQRYHDPFSINPGKDHEWCLGTLLNRVSIHDRRLQNPKDMANSMQDVGLAGTFFTRPGEDWQPGLHRVDRLLIKHPRPPQLPFKVKQVQFITALAGLTSHIPLGMTFAMGEHDDTNRLAGPLAHKDSERDTDTGSFVILNQYGSSIVHGAGSRQVRFSQPEILTGGIGSIRYQGPYSSGSSDSEDEYGASPMGRRKMSTIRSRPSETSMSLLMGSGGHVSMTQSQGNLQRANTLTAHHPQQRPHQAHHGVVLVGGQEGTRVHINEVDLDSVVSSSEMGDSEEDSDQEMQGASEV